MATRFPGDLDRDPNELPDNVADSDNLNSPNHATIHNNVNGAVLQIEEKLGTGDTTPSSGAVLIGTGTGTSAWDTTPTFVGDVTIPEGDLILGSTAVTSTAAELNLLDGSTAGTVVASKAVVVDADKDIASFRNVTLTGELDAATLDLSSSADIAGDLVLSGGADGALQFTNAGENSIKIPDNQASALIIEEADNAYITFTTTDSSEKITFAKPTQADNTITVGADDTGYDVKFHGATTTSFWEWDESAEHQTIQKHVVNTNTLDTVLELKVIETNDVDLAIGAGPGIDFYIPSGSSGNTILGATIGAEKRSSTDDNDACGIVFKTAVDGASPVEHMDISSTGQVTITNNELNGLKLKRTGSATVGNRILFEGSDGTDLGVCGMNNNDDFRIGVEQAGSNFFIRTAGEFRTVVEADGDLRPYDDNVYDLGTSSKRWDDVRATNGTIQTSDERDKTAITNIDLGLTFIDSLRPVTYKWDARSGYKGTRTHMGFLAQEVATAIGSDAATRAVWCQDNAGTGTDGDGNEETYPASQGLRYNELIAPLVKAVQELSARVTTLEG